jgi:hypothetical protein
MKQQLYTAHDEADALRDPNQGIPTRKVGTFSCDCGVVLSINLSHEDYIGHRRDYHGYCGYCKHEPCVCDGHGWQ